MAIRKNSPHLKAQLDAFVKTHGRGTAFGNITFRKYLENVKYAKGATSAAEIEKFTKIVQFFRKYGDRYEVDWLLMAAQGYQESGLDQSVQSRVGAVGVMQVMPPTGKQMNVGDISQVEPNIHAGVKYVRFVIDQYLKDEPMDRLNKGLFAFASYNAGPGRIRGLRAEARRQGLDPNVWFNNVERVASARIGRETVQYVSNIYKYYVAYQLACAENPGRCAGPDSARGETRR
jgi:membrane-bound lytic murein transglycosylase MltF